jgi:broad specificity phosphatase PhoE
MDLTDCTTQHRLTDQGRNEARAIGMAFQAHKIPVGRVLSSGYCRTMETARLAFGRAQASEVLLPPSYMPVPGAPVPPTYQKRTELLKELLATSPGPGTNTVLVTHGVNIKDALGFSATQGEAVIFRPDGRGGTTLVERVLATGWVDK